MKKTVSMILALTAAIGLVSCGGNVAEESSKEKETETTTAVTTAAEEQSEPENSTAETEPTAESEAAEPLNTNVTHAELTNTVLNIKASFDVANIDGFETKEIDKIEDSYRAKGSYGYPDPEWYASAVGVSYTIRPISAYHLEEFKNNAGSYEKYEKADLGSAYDTYRIKTEGSYGDSYEVVFLGGDYLDGAYVLELVVGPQLESGKQEDVDLIVDTFAKSLKLEADDSVVKTEDGFSIAQHGITCKNKAKVAGEEVDMTQCIFRNDNCISAQTEFTAEGIGYSFYTYSVDGMDHFGKMGGGEYADCTFADKPGKIKMTKGIGTIEIDADVQLDDDNCLHMSISSDSALQQGEFMDSAKLADAINEMLKDENKEATQEKFVGYINDILASFSFE